MPVRYHRRAPKSKGHGTLAELNTAKRLGGKSTPASGAMVGAKGDYHLGHQVKMENKATMGKALRLEAQWLCKVEAEAREVGMVPGLSLQFTNIDGRPRFTPWVAVPEWLFKELWDAYRSHTE